jgi:hypothetical protein
MTIAALLVAALVAGCGREQQDWRSAEAANTTEAYARFLEQHADSELGGEARARIAELAEERDWQHSDGIGTVEGYRSFLAQHPHGKWSEEARIRIEGFSLGSAPRTERQAQPKVAATRTGVNALLLATGVAAKVDGSAAAPVAVVPAAASDTGATPLVPAASPGETVGQTRVYAAVDPSDLAQPAPASEETHARRVRDPAGGYGVQLGAFGSAASADREWQRLQVRFSQELNGLSPRIVVAGGDAGQLYRLQAPAAGEAQARAICDSLRQQAQDCVPVIPR